MALSWFAAGCYYLATHQHDQARRHLTKATQLDRNCAPAWVAVGHACALQVSHGRLTGGVGPGPKRTDTDVASAEAGLLGWPRHWAPAWVAATLRSVV